jgi:hypothetical protein
VIILTEVALAYLTLEIQNGFASINARLDSLEEKFSKPGLATSKVRQEIAAAALKAATTRTGVKQIPRRTK